MLEIMIGPSDMVIMVAGTLLILVIMIGTMYC